MAFDENGNYYFDPTFDVEDAEAMQQAERTEQALIYRAQQRNSQQQGQVFQGTWLKALESAGISQSEYDALFSEDPNGAVELLGESMAGLAKGVASRKKQSKQSKQSPQPRQQKERTPLRESSDVITRATEKVNKGGRLSQDEELDILGAVLGADFNL